MKTFGVIDYTMKAPQRWFRHNNVSAQHSQKCNRILSNVHKIECTFYLLTHLQSVKNHYAMFEYKRMKTVGVTDYIN